MLVFQARGGQVKKAEVFDTRKKMFVPGIAPDGRTPNGDSVWDIMDEMARALKVPEYLGALKRQGRRLFDPWRK